jgi:hypothetical protein
MFLTPAPPLLTTPHPPQESGDYFGLLAVAEEELRTRADLLEVNLGN